MPPIVPVIAGTLAFKFVCTDCPRAGNRLGRPGVYFPEHRPDGRRPMKLSAVTVCVHESDRLACTLANRDQFERWLIVTVPKDRDTIALCRQHGLACHITHGLEPDGQDILAP